MAISTAIESSLKRAKLIKERLALFKEYEAEREARNAEAARKQGSARK